MILPDKQSIILFDGICNLCNGAVQFVIRHDKKKRFRFAALQSPAGQAFLKKYNIPQTDFNSFVLIQDGKAFTRSTAALKTAGQLGGFVKILYGFIIVPPFIRDAVYRLIAAKRYKWFGSRQACMVPTPDLRSRFLK